MASRFAEGIFKTIKSYQYLVEIQVYINSELVVSQIVLRSLIQQGKPFVIGVSPAAQSWSLYKFALNGNLNL